MTQQSKVWIVCQRQDYGLSEPTIAFLRKDDAERFLKYASQNSFVSWVLCECDIWQTQELSDLKDSLTSKGLATDG